MGEGAARIVEAVEAHWRPFRQAVDRLELERLDEKTPVGWTVKEMLATVAFWDEAVPGWVTLGIRQQPSPADGWRFGSGYVSKDEWPRDDVHNAREAEWGRSQTGAAVVARLDAAHELCLETLRTVTDREAMANADYFRRLGGHYDDHLPELQALLDGPTT